MSVEASGSAEERVVIRPITNWSLEQADTTLLLLEAKYVKGLYEAGPEIGSITLALDPVVAKRIGAALTHAAAILIARRMGKTVALDPSLVMSYHSDTQDTAEALLGWCSDSLNEGNVENALFAFYTGQLRRQLEMGLYPPDAMQGRALDLQRLEQRLSQTINKLAFTEPQVTARAMTRFEAWVPTLVADFVPGWPCAKPRNPVEVWPVIASLKSRQTLYLRGMIQMLADPTYREVCQRLLETQESETSSHQQDRDLETLAGMEARQHFTGMATQWMQQRQS